MMITRKVEVNIKKDRSKDNKKDRGEDTEKDGGEN